MSWADELNTLVEGFKLAEPLNYSATEGGLSRAPSLFLAGATGFVGAHVLAECLRGRNSGSSGKIFCLVREGDAAAGQSKLQRSLEKYGLWVGDVSLHVGRLIPMNDSIHTAILHSVTCCVQAGISASAPLDEEDSADSESEEEHVTEFDARVICVTGDLSLRKLGLSDAEYAILVEQLVRKEIICCIV